MYCSNCGKQISDQANFCNYCGAKVTAPQPRTGTAAPRQPQQPTYTAQQPTYTAQQNNYTAPAKPAPAKKEGVWGKRIVSGLVAVAVYFGVKYATQAFLTRNIQKPEPTTSNSGIIEIKPEAQVSLTDSCFYGALYQYDHVTYGLAKLYLPDYYLLPGEGDERDWLMANDDTCLFYAYKQLEFNCSFSASDEESILSSVTEPGSLATMVDFQKYNISGYPVIRYIAHYTDDETDQYVGELIVFPSETANETLRFSMFQLAETGYDKINQAFDTLTISADNALTYEDTDVMGLNRITVK